jgi:glucose-6-phosphate 1-dehydrogenase
MTLNQIEPHIFIIFGATGNLASRKLFPAIYKISAKEELKGKSIILGVARKNMDENSYRMLTYDMLKSAGLSIDDKDYSLWCDACLFYHSIGQGELEDYERLDEKIKTIERKNMMPGNRVFNMALPPNIFPKAIVGLSKAGLNHSPGWTRLVVEKPFGYDFESAKELYNLIHKYFDESQIYRIDHFLGKETVQNLLVFRFANAFFEHLWSREHIESVKITVAEKVGIEGRANYYEKIGALRDMVQNHLTQLLTMVAMEIPVALEANSIRNEKVKVLQQITPVTPEDVVLGQYTKGKIDNKEVPGYKWEYHLTRTLRLL